MNGLKQIWMVAILMALAIVFLVAPAAARIGYSTIQQGDIIFIYEKHLDINDLSGERNVTRLVHYSDFNAGTIDDFILVKDASDFSVPSTLRFPDAAYHAWDSAGLIDVADYVFIEMPWISLDVVSGDTPADKLSNMTIIKGTLVTFKITSNVPNGFNLDTSPPYVELLFTTPENSQILVFGGVIYNLVNLTSFDTYVSETDDFTVSDTTHVMMGVWEVQALWLDTGDFTSFYGEGVDSNIVTFTIASTVPQTTTIAPITMTTVPQTTFINTSAVPLTTTTVPTTVPQTTTPGFESVIALIGLGVVAVLVLHRH